MARKKPAAKQHLPATNKPVRNSNQLKGAERSAYFARREAAKVLRSVLRGDANRRAVASIKSLVYSPSVRNKRATYALVCQTLKYLPVIKDLLKAADMLNKKWKRQEELIYIITYDILFGQDTSSQGEAENFVLLSRDKLKAALSKILEKKRVQNIEDLIPLDNFSNVLKPRYIRVNTLKVDMETTFHELKKQYEVQKDDLVPDLLLLPRGTDLHNHPLVLNGHIFMQGKASCMVAVALGVKPGWQVIDACSAPGNKTIHLAALMKGKGKIIACELDEKRFGRLKYTVRLAGASNVKVRHMDFLNLDPEDPCHSKINAILLDPSCSGSGTAVDRLDHLLPSYSSGNPIDGPDINRLRKLAAFQKKVLEHAFSFPGVQRIVYSTCSIHQIENEDVIHSVLALAASHGFQLETVFPEWPRRGIPAFDGSEHLLRTDLKDDGEGFFIALFVRKRNENGEQELPREADAAMKDIAKNQVVKNKGLPRNYFFSCTMRLLFSSKFQTKGFRKKYNTRPTYQFP